MKNANQSLKIRSSALVGFKIPKDLYEEYDAFLGMPDPKGLKEEEPHEQYAKAKNALIEKLKKVHGYDALTKFGVDLPTDVVTMNMSLGSLAFDLWTSASPLPNSPLSRHAHAKRAQDLAVRMDKDELVITPEERKKISEALSDEDLWYQPKGEDDPRQAKIAGFSIWIDVAKDGKTEKVFSQVNAMGAGQFFELITKAVEWMTIEDVGVEKAQKSGKASDKLETE